MKKVLLVATCAILLCAGLLTIATPSADAAKAGYEVTNYVQTNSVTVDGTWTSTTEWTDAPISQLDGPSNVTFRLKYNYVNPQIYEYYLIENLNDTTLDAGDYFQLCYEAPSAVGGTILGGVTPQTDCSFFNYTGYSGNSGIKFFRGNGAAWVENASAVTWGTNFQIAATINSSPYSATPHLIIEVMIDHAQFSIGTPQWIRIAQYNAANTTAGWQMWPDSSTEIPNDWGLATVSQSSMPVPEGLGLGIMVALCAVAVVVGYRYFQKRPSTTNAANKAYVDLR